MKYVQYFALIAICFSFQNCSQNSAAEKLNLPDDYAAVKSRMISIYRSNQTLQQRQAATFSLLENFFNAYPLSKNTLVLLAETKNLSRSQFDSLYRHLNPSIKKDPYWGLVEITKSQIYAAETGKLFPEIILADTLNKTLNTSSLKGNIIFLDFWSSWCTSCREQFPHLKKIYEKYKPKGLQVIGISMDADRAAWMGALQHDSLPWPQFCELKRREENSVAQKFHIWGIPANFLIDHNGTLIGQDLSPGELETLLSRL